MSEYILEYILGSGLFGIRQADLIKNLRQMGDRICSYGPLGQWPRRCDCKYGATGEGEESGCPELALATTLINAMTPAEFKRIAKRAKVLING